MGRMHSRLPTAKSFPSNSAGKSKIATKLNAGIAESAPRAGLPSYLWQQGLGAGAIDAATDGRGLRGALETRRGGRAEAQPLSLPRSVCLQGFNLRSPNLATRANSACRQPLVIMEEEASILHNTGAFDRLPPNVIEL